METPYKITENDTRDSVDLIQSKLRNIRKDLSNELNSHSRDYDKLQTLLDRYIKTFKSNDLLLGYAIIDKEAV